MISHSELPSAGLGNKLFSWASGYIFSKVNNCSHYITGMTNIHIGPILRRESSKRFYRGYFKNERFFLPFRYWLYRKIYLRQDESGKKVKESACYVFNEIPHWSDSFNTIRTFRDTIINGFWESLTPVIKEKIESYCAPIFSVHIRMGDFRPLKSDEDFAKVGAVRTPCEYFIDIIYKIRTYAGSSLPVTVFSDGKDSDLEPILSLPNVYRAKEDLDIVHLALMSKSKIIVMSASSTFGFWAGFLSNAILINHYQHLHMPIRPFEINKKLYEGGVSPTDKIENIPLLQLNLKELNQSFVNLL